MRSRRTSAALALLLGLTPVATACAVGPGDATARPPAPVQEQPRATSATTSTSTSTSTTTPGYEITTEVFGALNTFVRTAIRPVRRCPSEPPLDRPGAAWTAEACPEILQTIIVVTKQVQPRLPSTDPAPPNGRGWDWPQLIDACEDLDRSLDHLDVTLASAPAGAELVVAAATAIVGELRAFADGCLAAAPGQDLGADQGKALVAHLAEAGTGLVALDLALAEVLQPD